MGPLSSALLWVILFSSVGLGPPLCCQGHSPHQCHPAPPGSLLLPPCQERGQLHHPCGRTVSPQARWWLLRCRRLEGVTNTLQPGLAAARAGLHEFTHCTHKFF